MNKEELRAAYLAGYEYAKAVEWGSIIFSDDGKGFDDWYEREVLNPPEGWDEHHD